MPLESGNTPSGEDGQQIIPPAIQRLDAGDQGFADATYVACAAAAELRPY